MAAAYRADAPALRLTVEAEGMTLLYHRPSGMTHLLASPAPELLEALAEGPADAARLLARLSSVHEIGDPKEAEAAITARLDEMAAAGLVARA